MKKRTFLPLAASALALLLSPPLQAQTFPAKPVTIVVPYAPGGPVDNLMRALGTRLDKEWGQPVLVLNKSGANEIIGAEFVAKSAPDGYTLLAATEAALTMNPHLYKKLPYNAEKDFTPVTRLISVPMVFFVPANAKANTLKAFIQQAKAAKDKPMSYGSSGAGGIVHLPLAMFAKQEGLDMVHIPYKGAAPLIPEVISGQVDSAVLGVSVIEQHVKAGKLKALAISSEARSVALPEVPTFKEAGVQDIDAVFNIGLVAPAGTPAAVVDKIAADLRRVLMAPDFRKAQIDAYSYVAVGSSPAEYKAFLARDLKVQGERVKTSGATLD
ncbi:tripartite tricarboxylate transporter substrate binding protein [Curvibacter sp. HBC28]|uniref:Tripartite tricarboxylate transporter substrate binding protein n=1 Tax=Curvibacter microcysteis TaxID=3026419 RepID=A0ABT5MDF5_9BURK|nr:tripartite tricarboxylate transporter substrate binding protein [Curvibacter sp. HBC28]MDD0814612.1 tripartite tricarboxylate transporter substrate binding protein [Curvibacter sp. HBC28]